MRNAKIISISLMVIASQIFADDANMKLAQQKVVTMAFQDGEKKYAEEKVGTINFNETVLRSCPTVTCPVKKTLSKSDKVTLIAATNDGNWLKTKEHYYVYSPYVTMPSNKDESKSPAVAKADRRPPVTKEETIDLSTTNMVADTNHVTTTFEEPKDNLLAQSGEMAKKYPNEALVVNLTKTTTPLPVKIPAKYARILITPVLSKEGDVYFDYNYAWVKIKDEEFVLGKREAKSGLGSNEFTIHKRVE